GGLLGYAYSSTSNTYATVDKTYATGEVKGGKSVGGLVGYGVNGSINNSFALNLKDNGNTEVGLAVVNAGYRFDVNKVGTFEKVGGNASAVNVTDLVSEKDMAKTETFYSFDFDSVWEMDNSGLPSIKNVINEHLIMPEYQKETTSIIHQGLV